MLDLIDVNRDYAVLSKPWGWLSEQCESAPNVPDALEAELRERNLPFEGIFCVHRLDRTTEGLMIYALNRRAAAALSELIRTGRLQKRYRAYLTPGKEPSPWETEARTDWLELRDRLFFDRRADKAFVVSPGKKGAKEAVLRLRLTGETRLPDRNGSVCLAEQAEIELLTGRSHQIRVQLGSRGRPLLGDGKYGSRANYRGPALFSIRLSFPWRGEEQIYEKTAPDLPTAQNDHEIPAEEGENHQL